MSKTTKAFRAELEAKRPIEVRVFHGPHGLAPEGKPLQGWANTAGLWVHWPLAGDYRVDRRTGKIQGTGWYVGESDLRELKRREVVILDATAEYRPVKSAVPRPR